MEQKFYNPEETFITGIFDSCDCGECEGHAFAAAGPDNGPFGDPFRGFRLWSEYFPS